MSKQVCEPCKTVVVLAVVVSAVIGDRAQADPEDSQKPGKAAEQLLGTWKMTSIEQNGQTIKPPLEMMFTFKTDTVEQKVAGRSQTSKYKLNADKPEHLDIVRERDGESRIFKMVFSIEGDKLRMCSGRPGAERPTKFASEGGYSIQLLERVKAQDE